jgi:hypothetical protein
MAALSSNPRVPDTHDTHGRKLCREKKAETKQQYEFMRVMRVMRIMRAGT